MQSRAHFRLLGTPVRVEPLFLIVAFMFAFRMADFGDRAPLWLIFACVVVIFLSILIHELGHALTYRFVGQRSAIVLHGFGGFTVPAGGGRRVLSKPKAVAVSISGALFQLAFLWFPARYFKDTDWAFEELLTWDPNANLDFNWWPILSVAAFINLWWAIFNLLPIRPLDGGHVAETLVGFQNACKLSIGAAIVAGFWALREGWFIATIMMGLFAFLNYRELKAGERSGMLEVEAPDEPSGRGGQRGSRHPSGASGGGGSTGGRRRKRSHLQPVPDLPNIGGSGRDSADIEAAAWNELRAGDADRAAVLLRQLGSSANTFLQASVALAQGHAGIAIDLFEAAYVKEPDGPPNLVPAVLLADSAQAVALTEVLVSNGSTGIAAAGSLQTHLHYADRFVAAAEVGELVFAAGPASPAQTAFEVACAWARADNTGEALRWVEAAIGAGFKAPSVLDSEPDLASVRQLPGWLSVRAQLG